MKRQAAVLLILGGCGAWPRHASLPDAGDPVPSDVDPRGSIEVDLADVVATPTTQPPGELLPELSLGEGFVLAGVLEGIGWNDVAEPAELFDEDCGTTGSRSPGLVPGDWAADVHAYAVTTRVAGRLCATLSAGDTNTGFDLLLWEVDACGIPVALREADGTAIGLGQVGPTVEWSTSVASGDRFSLLVAGYAPNRLQTPTPYDLTVSLVPDGTLCPSVTP
jgi:hypothetical protein